MENSEKASPEGQPSGQGWVQAFVARRGAFGLCFIVIVGLVYLAAAAKVYLSPTDYLGSVVVEFRPADGQRPDFEREVEILRAGKVLGEVERDLTLGREWNLTPAAAVDALRSKIEVEPLSSPQVARVSVFHTEATLAAKIADAIPVGYNRHKSRVAAETTFYQEEQLAAQFDQLTVQRDAAFDAWDMQRRRFSSDLEPSADGFIKLAELEQSPSSPSATAILDSGFMIGDTQGLGSTVEEAEADPQAVAEAKAKYESLVVKVEEAQAALDQYEANLRAMPPALVVHEGAVVSMEPARPVVDVEMRAAAWRAVGLGVLGGLIGMMLIPAWKSRAKTDRGTSPPTRGTARPGTVEY